MRISNGTIDLLLWVRGGATMMDTLGASACFHAEALRALFATLLLRIEWLGTAGSK